MREPQQRAKPWLNLPNVISGSRIALTPLVAWSVLTDQIITALTGLIVVVLSDLLDGIIARRRCDSNAFGTLIDHTADAIFVTTMSAVAAKLGLLPFALAPLIGFAFMQYVLDSRNAGDRTLRPSRLGRLNGVAYYLVVGAAMFVHWFLRDAVIMTTALMMAGWLLVATTVFSIVERAVYCLQSNRVS